MNTPRKQTVSNNYGINGQLCWPEWTAKMLPTPPSHHLHLRAPCRLPSSASMQKVLHFLKGRSHWMFCFPTALQAKTLCKAYQWAGTYARGVVSRSRTGGLDVQLAIPPHQDGRCQGLAAGAAGARAVLQETHLLACRPRLNYWRIARSPQASRTYFLA